MELRDDETDDRPLYSHRRRTAMRTIVIVAIAAMLLPVLANLFTVNIATANDACAEAVAYASPDAVTSSARFELFGPGGVGWSAIRSANSGATSIVS